MFLVYGDLRQLVQRYILFYFFNDVYGDKGKVSFTFVTAKACHNRQNPGYLALCISTEHLSVYIHSYLRDQMPTIVLW